MSEREDWESLARGLLQTLRHGSTLSSQRELSQGILPHWGAPSFTLMGREQDPPARPVLALTTDGPLLAASPG